MDEIVEVKDAEVKKVFLAITKVEEETGKSIPDILLEMAYGDDPSLALGAIKLIYEVTMSSDLTEEDFEEDPELLAEVLPFGNRESLEEGEE